MRPALAITLVATCALFPGCHSSTSAPAPGESAGTPGSGPAQPATASAPIANPCTLATVDEVSEAMGRKSKPGELHDAFNGKRCNFYDPTSQYEIFLQTVDWGMAGPMMTPENTLNGIGEKAFWMDGSIYVLKNGHGMMIGFQLPHVLPSMTPQAEKLAKIIAGRM
jgi:hypothetical protein